MTAGCGVVDAEQLHLTLAFLGHRPPEEIARSASWSPRWARTRRAPALRTAGALWLSPRRPHVLAVAVRRRRRRAGGAARPTCGTRWRRSGHARERRAFRPHLTVARVRRGWTAPAARRCAGARAGADRAGAASALASWLGGGPARYEALARAPALAAGFVTVAR